MSRRTAVYNTVKVRSRYVRRAYIGPYGGAESGCTSDRTSVAAGVLCGVLCLMGNGLRGKKNEEEEEEGEEERRTPHAATTVDKRRTFTSKLKTQKPFINQPQKNLKRATQPPPPPRGGLMNNRLELPGARGNTPTA
mmetsp:Transcript_67933/g.116724  ORF Transcript_67933/g.116724 Transcript_67933/m.116724 type:complete len:137 (-) Transcript_67933:15-425(-)